MAFISAGFQSNGQNQQAKGHTHTRVGGYVLIAKCDPFIDTPLIANHHGLVSRVIGQQELPACWIGRGGTVMWAPRVHLTIAWASR